MLKLTPAKLLLSLTLVAVSFSPLLFAGSGMMIALPVLQIFWLAGLVQALGAQVTDGPGVDAFTLVPPNFVGILLILVGSAISLGAYYVLAAFLVTIFSRRR